MKEIFKIRSAITITLLIISLIFPANISFAAPSEQLIFHHPDHLSGASVDTDASGNVIESIDYYPYGEIRIDAKTTTYENKHKFTGKELDESDNLYYYGARYYDPTIGRFISADPFDGDLSNPQSQNKYSYALNNPLKYVDPTGNFAMALFAIPFIEMAVDAAIIATGAFLISIRNENLPNITDLTPPPIADTGAPYTTPAYTGDSYNVETIPVTTKSFGPLVTTPPNVDSQYFETFPDDSNIWGKEWNIMTKERVTKFRTTLPRDQKTANYLPDPAAIGAHTRLGKAWSKSTNSWYKQAATFDAFGNFLGKTDLTKHHAGDHENPHFHPATSPNGTEGGKGYSPNEYWKKFSSVWKNTLK